MTTTSSPEHSRTFNWEDPLQYIDRGGTLSAADYLSALATGELPHQPFSVLMGMKIAEFEEGRVSFKVTPAEWHMNAWGVAHGGLVASLLDTAMAHAVHSAGGFGTTLELKVNYLRPATVQTSELTGTGTVIHRGKTVATTEGRVTDAEGKLYAHGTSTCMLLGTD